MSDPTPPRIGAHLPYEGVGRRHALVLGGLGVAGLIGARLPAGLAHALPRSDAGVGLPAPPPAPRPGTRPREPFSSGALGPWRASTHSRSTKEEETAAVRGDGIHLLGDSIGTRLLPVLRARLGGRPLSYDVWNGRPTAPALQALAELKDAGRLAPTVLAVVGSNDVFDPWRFEADVRHAREIVGRRRRLLWVTPYVSRPSARSADLRNTAVLGLALERAAANDTVELVRWFDLLARSQDRMGQYIRDGLHPTDLGARRLADLVVATLG